MALEESGKLTKQARREQRRRAARRRSLLTRLRRTGIIAAVLGVPGLWALECSGPQVMVDAQVTETRQWPHANRDGTYHQHTSATLQIEGLSDTTVRRADGYERGQRVPVWIRRGRISGWPYFLDVAKPGEIERHRRQGETEETP